MAPASAKKNKTAAEVVKAVDLAPQAFGGAAGTTAANGGGGDALKDKPDDLQYDLRHLTALDSHPVRVRVLSVDCARVCASITDQLASPSPPNPQICVGGPGQIPGGPGGLPARRRHVCGAGHCLAVRGVRNMCWRYPFECMH